MDDYRYRPLDAHQPGFRLIKLRKADRVNIECDIFHAVISDPKTLPYEALSYSWGSTDLVDSIDIHGQRLWITENLYTALQCLRFRDRDRILWIDAICINQADKEEQSRQVLQMGKIFSFATRVIFWLGKPTSEATSLMLSLHELQMKGLASSQANITLDDVVWRRKWLSLQRTRESRNADWSARLRRGLEVLLKRPWFDRVWILQEVLNAQSAIVCSGALSVSADIFAISPSLLNTRPKPQVQSVLDLMPRSDAVKPQYNQGRDELISLVLKFRASKATDKRDMIFALLGMSSEPLDHELLRPDYTKPVEEVVHDAICYWFDATTATISQVMRFLSTFETIRTTYLVLPETTTNTSELVHVLSSPSEHISCARDASLFSVEPETQDILHNEILHLKQTLHGASGGYNETLRVVSWENPQQHVKLLVVERFVEAFVLTSRYGYRHILRLIANRCTRNKPKLLCSALIMILDGTSFTDMLGYSEADRIDEETKWKAIQALLDEGANINAAATGFVSCTALQVACLTGSIDIVRLLVEKGADVNAPGGEFGTAIQAAYRSVNWSRAVEIVHLLLENGADVSAQSGTLGSPLLAASRHGHLEVVQLLLEKGTDISVMHGADYSYSKQMRRLLRDHGAKIPSEEEYIRREEEFARRIKRTEEMTLTQK